MRIIVASIVAAVLAIAALYAGLSAVERFEHAVAVRVEKAA